MKKTIKGLFLICIAILMAGCDVNEENVPTDLDNWKGWEGLKELMIKAGFDTNGIKPSHSTSSDWLYLPDILSDVIVWCGTKNGEPWVGIGHSTIYDSIPQTFFDYDFVWEGQKSPETMTFFGYGKSMTGNYTGSSVNFILVDDDYYYMLIGNRYVINSQSFSNASTLLFVNRDGHVVGKVDNFSLPFVYYANVGYEHDLIINDTCYSISGEKLYNIPTENRKIYGAKRSLSRLTTPLDHKNFVFLDYRVDPYTDFNEGGYFNVIEVCFANLSGETENNSVKIQFDGNYTDHLDRFELLSNNNGILTYEIELTKYSGEKIMKRVVVDSMAKTAELI